MVVELVAVGVVGGLVYLARDMAPRKTASDRPESWEQRCQNMTRVAEELGGHSPRKGQVRIVLGPHLLEITEDKGLRTSIPIPEYQGKSIILQRRSLLTRAMYAVLFTKVAAHGRPDFRRKWLLTGGDLEIFRQLFDEAVQELLTLEGEDRSITVVIYNGQLSLTWSPCHGHEQEYRRFIGLARALAERCTP